MSLRRRYKRKKNSQHTSFYAVIKTYMVFLCYMQGFFSRISTVVLHKNTLLFLIIPGTGCFSVLLLFVIKISDDADVSRTQLIKRFS